jgi:hypothetical protein
MSCDPSVPPLFGRDGRPLLPFGAGPFLDIVLVNEPAPATTYRVHSVWMA